MKPRSLTVMGVAALLVLGQGIVRTRAFAQDVVKVAPDKYKVLLENDRVRVLEYRAKPGDKTPMHSHPSYLIYSFTGGKAKFTAPDGKTTERDLKAGEVTWNNGETHATETMGEAHVLLVELKEPQTKK
jgi:quercetin dioxygenase-like cupin family protein